MINRNFWSLALLTLVVSCFSTIVAALNESKVPSSADLKGYEDVCPNVSHKHKYVWFRIGKAASSSTAKMLDQAGKRDIIYPKLDRNPASDRVWMGVPKFDPEEYKGYFLFTFVRNPWDRLVSCYFTKVKRKLPALRPCWGMSFEQFIQWIDEQDLTSADIHVRPQVWQVPLKELDFVGRVETFDQDIRHVMKVLGLKCPRIEHCGQSGHGHYSMYYNDSTRETVAKKYKEDIETFGYTFESK